MTIMFMMTIFEFMMTIFEFMTTIFEFMTYKLWCVCRLYVMNIMNMYLFFCSTIISYIHVAYINALLLK